MRMMTWNLMAAGAAIAAIAFARVAGFPSRAVGAAESASGVSCPTGEGIQRAARAARTDPAVKPGSVNPGVPPIDAQRPPQTETATFALG
jgi:hypothetical protein